MTSEKLTQLSSLFRDGLPGGRVLTVSEERDILHELVEAGETIAREAVA